ncbi:carboxylesterase family protein [Streptomyces sp. GMY02]|uniref:carboxylesterase/lipase family protein n=1 Tax=Streptomyces sp. GMY02 TaxID=1333528 RepID=UPI001C2C4755|nr:carboxylesterase family protein [Streptomyces sp. GMY02]QXE33869.1 carboxylesterase family protein [Streptomyces sp. GMY02]
MTSADFTTVTTTQGPVRGRRDEHGTVFLNVPYAAPPTARSRFTAPSPHSGWTEVRDATRPGPTAPQPVRDSFGTLDMSPYFGPGWQRGKDYLTVNIWAPPPEGPPRPVMVFVHGGGFVAGSNRAPLYDGTAFARDGVVLITVNHRLGIPGFLHLPDAPDNRGMLDVLAALHWVHDNIARFGGDPGNLTLFGQSAGAIIVGGILADPASSGLVRRAIIQSGSGTAAFTPEQAGIVTAAVGRELEIEPTAETLADIPDEHLVDLLPHLTGLDLRTATHHHPLAGITPFSLVSEQQPATALAARRSGTDLLIGSNLDEGSLYLAPLGVLAGSTEADLLDTAARFHPRPADAVRGYQAKHPAATTAELRTLILGDGLFGTGTRRMAAAHASAASGRTHCYEFLWRSDAIDGQLGASHVMELPFVFDRLSLASLHGPRGLLGSTEPPAELAGRIHRSWVRFAETGSPGWPIHEPAGGHVERLGAG